MRKVMVLVVGVAVLAAAGRFRGRGACEDDEGRDGHRCQRAERPRFNHLAYVGLQQAQKRLGITFRVAESRSTSDYIPNLAAFARQGYDLVVGVGYTEIGAMGAVAKRFPQTQFAIVDVANGDLAGKPKNVLGLLFREEQVGYLAGYLAGLEAKRLPGRDLVSSVARREAAAVDRFIAGYQAGRRRRTRRSRSRTPTRRTSPTRPNARSIALNQISAGSLAVFAVAGALRFGGARRCPRTERLGDRRRCRPVVPRPADPDQRDEEGRSCGVPRGPVGAEGLLPRRQCRLRPPRGGRRARQDQPEGAEVGGRGGRADPAAADRRDDPPAAGARLGPRATPAAPGVNGAGG